MLGFEFRFVLSFHGHLCQARPDFIDTPTPGIQPKNSSIVFLFLIVFIRIVFGRRPHLRPIGAAAGPPGEAVEVSPLRLLPRARAALPPVLLPFCCRLRRRPGRQGDSPSPSPCHAAGGRARSGTCALCPSDRPRAAPCTRGASSSSTPRRSYLPVPRRSISRALCAAAEWRAPHLAPSSTRRSSASFSSCTRCRRPATPHPNHGNR